MPKLSGLVNEQERAISARIRSVRLAVGWTQEEFSNALGLTRIQVAALEYGTTPLRYALGDRICQKFDISQQWLATNQPPMQGYIGLPLEIGAELQPRELFSAAYARRIGHIVRRSIREAEELKRSMEAGIAGQEQLRDGLVYNLVRTWFSQIDPAQYRELFGVLSEAASSFVQRRRLVGDAHNKNRQESLDREKRIVDKSGVQKRICSWPELVREIKRRTKERGEKAALARKFNVTRQAVDQWLSGTAKPSADITLELLNWVESAK